MGAASGGQKAKGGRKNRKHSRNKDWCAAYRARNTAAKNRIVKLARYLRRWPQRDDARAAMQRVWKEVRGRDLTAADMAGFRVQW